MEIDWLPGGEWRQEKSAGQRNDAGVRLDRVNRLLERMEQAASRRTPGEDARYRELQKIRSELMAELDKPAGQEEKAGGGVSTYRNAFIALQTSVPEDPDVRNIIDRTARIVDEKNKRRLAGLRQEMNTAELAGSLAGWQSCRSCHPAQTERWQETDHAGAWDTLAAVRQQDNRDCLICHVTLPTYTGETVVSDKLIASLTPELRGVSCESCHGPGKKHVAAPESVRMIRPTARTCTVCHTPDRDDDFDFARKSNLLGCPAAEK